MSRWPVCENYRNFFVKQVAEEFKNLEKMRKELAESAA